MVYILLKYQKVYPFNCSNVSYAQMADFLSGSPLLHVLTPSGKKKPLIVISPIRPNLKNLSNESNDWLYFSPFTISTIQATT